MPQLAANLTMMFTEYPFMDRFRAASDAGFKWVEMLFPYKYGPDELNRAVESAGLRVALFNLPPGDWEAGERGLACHPGRRAELDIGLKLALPYAEALNVTRLHLMAGVAPASVAPGVVRQTYLENVRHVAGRLAERGMQVMLEPINGFSMPGYFLRTQEQAAEIIENSGMENVRLQFDFFHCQMEQGCVLRRLERFLPLVGHCQIAGAPERHEPDTGELNHALALARLDELGYTGLVGLEYSPRNGTEAGLAWAAPWLSGWQ